MTFILGIDAGASKTFALVADGEGRVLGYGRGGPGNPRVPGLQRRWPRLTMPHAKHSPRPVWHRTR